MVSEKEIIEKLVSEYIKTTKDTGIIYEMKILFMGVMRHLPIRCVMKSKRSYESLVRNLTNCIRLNVSIPTIVNDMTITIESCNNFIDEESKFGSIDLIVTAYEIMDMSWYSCMNYIESKISERMKSSSLGNDESSENILYSVPINGDDESFPVLNSDPDSVN